MAAIDDLQLTRTSHSFHISHVVFLVHDNAGLVLGFPFVPCIEAETSVFHTGLWSLSWFPVWLKSSTVRRRSPIWTPTWTKFCYHSCSFYSCQFYYVCIVSVWDWKSSWMSSNCSTFTSTVNQLQLFILTSFRVISYFNFYIYIIYFSGRLKQMVMFLFML